MRICLVLLSTLCLTTVSLAADLQVLVIGSTRPYPIRKGVQAFKGDDLVKLVQNDFVKDPEKQAEIKVSFEDIYRVKSIPTAVGQRGGKKPWSMEYHCHSLAQWYFWPEGRAERLANLRGEGKTKWDVIMLVGDPFLIGSMPGMYAEGVKLVVDEIKKGPAKPLLLMPWAKEKKAASLANVVCRVAEGAGIAAVPSSLAKKTTAKLKGSYETPNPFLMKYVNKRVVTYHHTGSSSERGIEGSLKRTAGRCGISLRRLKAKEGEENIDFNYGRGNANFEANKRYKVQPDIFDRSYGFPMQDQSRTATVSQLYGIDKRLHDGRRFDDGTDLGIGWTMIRNNIVRHDIRCIPIRIMWAKMHDADPELKPLGDGWHMSRVLLDASAAFLYTLLSGRCPVGTEFDPKDTATHKKDIGFRIGYETAWRMSHLGARVPGFVVRPRSKDAALPANGKAEVEVRFCYPPRKDVTVTITAPEGMSVKPYTLTFTPENHGTAQTVTLTNTGLKAGSAVEVEFTTSSNDKPFDQLRDVWSYQGAAK